MQCDYLKKVWEARINGGPPVSEVKKKNPSDFIFLIECTMNRAR